MPRRGYSTKCGLSRSPSNSADGDLSLFKPREWNRGGIFCELREAPRLHAAHDMVERLI